MKTVVLHPEAETEFEEATDFLDSRRPGYGERFRAEVAAALAQIGGAPGAFGLHKNGPTRRRMINSFGYAVYYLERASAVHVLAIANQRRKPGYWLDRLNDI